MMCYYCHLDVNLHILSQKDIDISRMIKGKRNRRETLCSSFSLRSVSQCEYNCISYTVGSEQLMK